jgi:hypothetical protein
MKKKYNNLAMDVKSAGNAIFLLIKRFQVLFEWKS